MSISNSFYNLGNAIENIKHYEAMLNSNLAEDESIIKVYTKDGGSLTVKMDTLTADEKIMLETISQSAIQREINVHKKKKNDILRVISQEISIDNKKDAKYKEFHKRLEEI